MGAKLAKGDWVLINLTITAYEPLREGAVERQILAYLGGYIEVIDGWFSIRRVIEKIDKEERK
jgi:hypothetical protein